MSWREFRSLLFGLSADSRTAQWISNQNSTASRQTDVLDSPEDVMAFLGFNPQLQDA
jgi:hypothetical protein